MPSHNSDNSNLWPCTINTAIGDIISNEYTDNETTEIKRSFLKNLATKALEKGQPELAFEAILRGINWEKSNLNKALTIKSPKPERIIEKSTPYAQRAIRSIMWGRMEEMATILELDRVIPGKLNKGVEIEPLSWADYKMENRYKRMFVVFHDGAYITARLENGVQVSGHEHKFRIVENLTESVESILDSLCDFMARLENKEMAEWIQTRQGIEGINKGREALRQAVVMNVSGKEKYEQILSNRSSLLIEEQYMYSPPLVSTATYETLRESADIPTISRKENPVLQAVVTGMSEHTTSGLDQLRAALSSRKLL